MPQPLTEAQQALVAEYLPLARKAAEYYIRRHWQAKGREEIVMDTAITHLMLCSQYHDASKGASFKSYYLGQVNLYIYNRLGRRIAREYEEAVAYQEVATQARHRKVKHDVSHVADADQVKYLLENAKLTRLQREAIDEYLSVKTDYRCKTEQGRAARAGLTRQALSLRLHLALKKLRKLAKRAELPHSVGL